MNFLFKQIKDPDTIWVLANDYRRLIMWKDDRRQNGTFQIPKKKSFLFLSFGKAVFFFIFKYFRLTVCIILNNSLYGFGLGKRAAPTIEEDTSTSAPIDQSNYINDGYDRSMFSTNH